MTAAGTEPTPREPAPNVHVEVYDTAVLCYLYPEWPALSKQAKLARVRAHVPSPAARGAEHNTTCVGLHEFLPKVLDPDVTASTEITHLAVGDSTTDGGGNGPASGDTALFSEVGRVRITDSANDGPDVLYEVFIDSSELNGEMLRELGLFDGPASDADAVLLNHSLVSPEVDKTNSKTVIFTVTLSFAAA